MSVTPDELHRLRPLQAVPTADIEALLPLGSQLDLARAEVVFEPGDPCTYGLLLVRGRLAVSVVAGASERPVGDIWPGEVAGEAAFFETDAVHRVRVRAVGPSTVLVVTPELLEAARGTQALAAMQRHLVSAMARRIRSTNRSIHQAWHQQRVQAVSPAPAERRPARPTTLREHLGRLLGGPS